MVFNITAFTFSNTYAKTKHGIRIYSVERSSKIVLEDIVVALLTQPDSDISAELDEAKRTTEELIELAGIEPIKVNDGIHLATVDQMEDFYDYCDSLGNYGVPTVYESLGHWWVGIRELMENKQAHMGTVVARLPMWGKEQERARQLFGENYRTEKHVKVLIAQYCNLSVNWIIEAIRDKIKTRASYVYRDTTGEVPGKVTRVANSVETAPAARSSPNAYTPEFFVTQMPAIAEELNSPRGFIERCRGNNNIKDQIAEDKQKVEEKRSEGKTDDEIIEAIWEVTPSSHLVQLESEGERRNYQYEILKAFVATCGGRHVA
ncbi:hypothetical protein SD80_032385 [Scytonema tolypothrichoides VB-61278]|nr:hypothetical protein SD80_032385 [Scytonema tolypothrichoides VB-61278]